LVIGPVSLRPIIIVMPSQLRGGSTLSQQTGL
jgi:hypothetical protein